MCGSQGTYYLYPDYDKVPNAVFLNRGSAEPWGSVGIPQGFRRDDQWFHKIFIFLGFLNLLVDLLGKIVAWVNVTLLIKRFMFGTNSICYQRPKAGYKT